MGCNQILKFHSLRFSLYCIQYFDFYSCSAKQTHQKNSRNSSNSCEVYLLIRNNFSKSESSNLSTYHLLTDTEYPCLQNTAIIMIRFLLNFSLAQNKVTITCFSSIRLCECNQNLLTPLTYFDHFITLLQYGSLFSLYSFHIVRKVTQSLQ